MSYGHYPPQNHYGGYGAPQPPAPPADPFRAWYADRLAELTFNSRPIIQTLSLEAMNQRDQNNWNGMQAIVEEVEAAILRAPPQGKLPLLYLLDSISKNVGPPYTDTYLPSIMPRLYLQTYREVDGVTKSKMEEMLKLWRTGGQHGGELYPAGVRETVEREILGAAPPVALTRIGVQHELRDFLREKEAEMAQEFTTKRARTVNVLVQIDQLLTNSHVAPKELAEIAEKVRAMKAGLEPSSSQAARLAAPAAAAAAAPGPIPAPAPGPPQPAYGGYGPRGAYPPPQQQQYPPQQQYPAYPPAQQYPPPAQQYPPAPAPPVQAPVAIPAAIPAINVADILRNLNSSGVLSQPRTPEPSAAAKTSLDSYEDMILALDMSIDVFDLSKLSLPVSHLPVRCKQCGLRFPEGENKLQAHMDWHFRRNRKERETDGRGAHRRWLPRAEEWINENVEGAGPSSTSPKKSDSALPVLTGERLAALKRKWVPAPSDPVKAKKPCPICKEQFKSEWSEDEEEWVFMNAVETQGTIYHATCKATRMSSAVTARLLGNERAGSKSPAPSEDGSTKRKAIDDASDADDSKRVKVEPVEGAEEANPEVDVEEKEEVVIDKGGSEDVAANTAVQETDAPAPAPAPAPVVAPAAPMIDVAALLAAIGAPKPTPAPAAEPVVAEEEVAVKGEPTE